MSRKRKIDEVDSVEQTQAKRIRDQESSLVASFSSLPLEILSQHILKFFDFKQWLRLVIVCKQWQNAARQSRVHKQLIYTQDLDESVACSILSKYNVNVLVIARQVLKLTALARLLSAAPATSTLVLDTCDYPQIDGEDFQFDSITTLSVAKKWLISFFPNVTRLKLSKLALTNYLSNDRATSSDSSDDAKDVLGVKSYPCVKELEANLTRAKFDSALLKETFPSLSKLYLNYVSGHREATLEKKWKKFEEAGRKIGVQVICRNPHLSTNMDVFSLTSVSYREFFDGFGQTPVRKLFQEEQPNLGVALFAQYSSKAYEVALTDSEPQFHFPTRSTRFKKGTKSYSPHSCSNQTLLAMVHCGHLNYWSALGHFDVETTLDNLTEVLQEAKHHLPPTEDAPKSLCALIARCSTRIMTQILESMGEGVFFQVARTESSDGRTFLHHYTSDITFCETDHRILMQYCDVNAKDKDGFNAATLAFISGDWHSWIALIQDGAIIQSEFYSSSSSKTFLEAVLANTVPLKLLELFDKSYLQKLLRVISRVQLDVDSRLELFTKLVQLGADLNHVKEGKRPIIADLAYSRQIEYYWPTIENMDLNKTDPDGFTPLMISINKGFIEQVEILLQNGANPNVCGRTKAGKITAAVFLPNVLENNPPQLRLLLKSHGADFTLEDEEGNNIVNYAIKLQIKLKNIEFFAGLVSLDKPNHANITPLAQAVCNNFLVSGLIRAGADLNKTAGALNKTPLMMALETNLGCVLNVLDNAGVDLTIKDKFGRSVLYYLLRTENNNLLDRLLEPLQKHFNKPHIIQFVRSEVHALLANPDLAFLRTKLLSNAAWKTNFTEFALRELGLGINEEDSNGDTMLTLSAERMAEEVVDFLLTNGADVNHQNKQKNTALMIVINRRDCTPRACERIERRLVAAGASLTIKNIWGHAPIDVDPTLESLRSVSKH